MNNDIIKSLHSNFKTTVDINVVNYIVKHKLSDDHISQKEQASLVNTVNKLLSNMNYINIVTDSDENDV